MPRYFQMLSKMLDELRQSLQLFETSDPEVAHLVSLVEDVRDILSTLNYEIEKLKEKKD